MKILAIETSCDETAISIVEAKGRLPAGRPGIKQPSFNVLANVVSSQAMLHAKWGGVVPNLAKREHQLNLVPVIREALDKAKIKSQPARQQGGKAKIKAKDQKWTSLAEKIRKILARETELIALFLDFIKTSEVPRIDAIAVTRGPGLEPALWVGINLAKAMALAWGKPLIPINHMEGHIYSVLIQNSTVKTGIEFPALALLVSGGHTELVLIKDWLKHKIIGQTLDDAVGEAFDKAARLLGLPYPGGPEISKLAKKHDTRGLPSVATEGNPRVQLPRPMLHSPDFNFSYSGLKTAVLYLVNKLRAANPDGNLTDEQKIMLAYEFEQAAVEVLIKKTAKAIAKFKPKTLIIAGGVAANQELGRQAEEMIEAINAQAVKPDSKIKLLISTREFSTDNATMIAVAAYLHLQKKTRIPKNFTADGGLVLK